MKRSIRATFPAASRGDLGCIERFLPTRKDRPLQLQIPEIEGVQDVTKATVPLLKAVAAGALTPAEAGEVAKLVEVHRQTVLMAELEHRLQRIEEGQRQWRG